MKNKFNLFLLPYLVHYIFFVVNTEPLRLDIKKRGLPWLMVLVMGVTTPRLGPECWKAGEAELCLLMQP